MEHLTILQAIVLGVVEGITEYLPISSTGHLIITAALLGLDEPPERKNAVDAFMIVIQGGAILAVLGLYRARLLQMIKGLLGRDAVGLRFLRNLLVAFAPAALLGPFLDTWIQSKLFAPLPVFLALLIGGIVMIGLTPWQRAHFEAVKAEGGTAPIELDELSWQRALMIGLLQCVAMWPGTSRSMMTIVGGMLVGMRPKQAAEFSFLLGLPTLGGACAYKLLRNITEDGGSMLDLGVTPLLAGMVAATISAAFAIKWLVGFLGHHGVALFGWYRIALCLVLGALWWSGAVSF